MKSSTVTILFVEDNEIVRGLVKEILVRQGWFVSAYGDASSALQELEGDGSYDLIITDNGLPGICGLELVKCVRKLPTCGQIPIIMFSSDTAYADAAVIAGANVFLRKPEDVDLLSETVARLVHLDAIRRTAAVG